MGATTDDAAMRLIYQATGATLYEGDCLDVLRSLPDASIDAIVTDPPAGISFMGRGWDSNKGGRDAWVAWLAERMTEALRVVKPGGHALVWALPRTSHWTATAIEDAGWEIRDRVSHLFGSGFPKNLDVSKAIDKAAGVEREAIERRLDGTWSPNSPVSLAHGNRTIVDRTVPATDAARQWDGFGTALKPAVEDWWLARKPLHGTVAANVLRHGTGALNIDATRVSLRAEEDVDRLTARSGGRRGFSSDAYVGGANDGKVSPGWENSKGRWPAHLILSHTPDCGEVGTRRARGTNPPGQHGFSSGGYGGGFGPHTSHGYHDADGLETVEAWSCAPGCPVAELDRQTDALHSAGFAQTGGNTRNRQASIFGIGNATRDQIRHDDSGGASRFFYTAKSSRSERDADLDDLDPHTGGTLTYRQDGSAGMQSPRAGAGRTSGGRNTHPTVKPLALMQWLVRLITPPGGVVLDLFMGSGSTGVAVLREGFQFVGVDSDPESCAIAVRRVGRALGPLFAGEQL